MSSRGFNSVQVFGNLGADPELRYTGNGTAVVNLRIAENTAYKNREGALVEKTIWHSAVAFARTAEVIAEYLNKGDEIQIVRGRLDYNEWTDKNDSNRRDAEIHILEFRFGRKAGENNGSTRNEKKATPKRRVAEPDDTFAPDDELPF